MELLFDLPITERDITEQDFGGFNAEVDRLWADFASGKHERVPIRLNSNVKVLILNPTYNKRNITFVEYFHNPDVMAEAQLNWQLWRRYLLPGDHEHGLPASWELFVDFQNVYDACWFGCPLHYVDEQGPVTKPILTDDKKEMLFDRGIPNPFEGWVAQCSIQYLDHFNRRVLAGWEFLGRPVGKVWKAPLGWTDGVFTIATLLRGAEAICMDILLDPVYVHRLMSYITEALIVRMRKWLEYMGVSYPMADWWFADDAVQLLSAEQYREFVLPYHRRLYDTFAGDCRRYIHLCGAVQHLLPIIRQELGVTVFDTGFPIDFGRLRKELGLDCIISGGPRASLFLPGCSEDLLEETIRILRSGILEGGNFILQEGNNLPVGVNLHSCQLFYDLGKELGRVR